MTIVALYLFLPFFGSLIIGIPVAFSIGLASVIFLLFSGAPIPPLVLITEMYTGVNQLRDALKQKEPELWHAKTVA